ncbi:MAG TPA: hypothetical protein VG015_00395, partial [Candidatus Dormibacteraeota bacterium]|nr:hypothetical protein [Candidatus Dormibacteraeota bacterium]
WLETMKKAVELAPQHLSCYTLTFEPGTLLTRRLAQGKLPPVESDQQWEQLDLASKFLADAGYCRYEVSNWSQPGRESRHNLAYWGCEPVYGAGAGAHSYATDGSSAWRWWDVALPRDYIAASARALPVEDGEVLEPAKARAEATMLALRTTRGISVKQPIPKALRDLTGAGLLEVSGDRLVPTRRGLDLHNQIALALL